MARQIKRKKGQKYHNHKCEYRGITFDSERERDRYIILKEAEDNGIISNLQMQVSFELIPAIKENYVVHLKTKDKVKERTIQKATTYKCDFQYKKDGKTIVEDVKISPFLIPKDFRLKEKLMLWRHGIQIKKVFEPNEEI